MHSVDSRNFYLVIFIKTKSENIYFLKEFVYCKVFI